MGSDGNWNIGRSRCNLDIISGYEHLSRGNHAARAPWITPSLTYTPILLSVSLTLSHSYQQRHLPTLSSRLSMSVSISLFLPPFPFAHPRSLVRSSIPAILARMFAFLASRARVTTLQMHLAVLINKVRIGDSRMATISKFFLYVRGEVRLKLDAYYILFLFWFCILIWSSYLFFIKLWCYINGEITAHDTKNFSFSSVVLLKNRCFHNFCY